MTKELTPIGIVGCGALGKALLQATTDGRLPVPVAGVTSRTVETAKAFLATLPDPPLYLELDELIARSGLVVETAGAEVVPELARRTFAAGKALLVISMGALLDHPELIDLAREKNCRLILPSGAMAGLDGIKSACEGRVDHVTIITRKPIESIADAPYLIEHGISLEGLTEELEVYRGPVREAVRGFPENVNVAACVSLAGLGPDKTTIRISAVPDLKRNSHTVEVEGEFGSLTIGIANIPSENPSTGKLTAMSIIRTIKDVLDPFQIGT
ncbi:MAG: aspartate dehydrogenase [SAR324 cluster bacterium]|nr:aspartate dehydrogenase [SAR324 cluster bacterium]